MRRPLARKPALPDMAPIAALWFVVVCFFVLSTRFKQPVNSVVADSELPFSSSHAGKLPENNVVVIGLTQDNRWSFAITDSAVQAAVARQLGQSHGADAPYLLVAETQVLSCLALAQRLVSAAGHRPPYVFLKAEAQVGASRMLALAELLRDHDHRRLGLLIQNH